LKTLRGLPLVLAKAREWLRTVGRRGSREAVAKLTTLALRCVVRRALGLGFLLVFSEPSYHTPHPTPPLGQYAFPHVRQSLKKVFPELISVGVPL
jgi:hypothetical protein